MSQPYGLAMQKWIVVTLFVSCNAMAYNQQQDETVRAVIHEAKRRGYSDEDAKLAARSNVFEIPDLAMCIFLPELTECKK
jgi:hypothetical protein